MSNDKPKSTKPTNINPGRHLNRQQIDPLGHFTNFREAHEYLIGPTLHTLGSVHGWYIYVFGNEEEYINSIFWGCFVSSHTDTHIRIFQAQELIHFGFVFRELTTNDNMIFHSFLVVLARWRPFPLYSSVCVVECVIFNTDCVCQIVKCVSLLTIYAKWI